MDRFGNLKNDVNKLMKYLDEYDIQQPEIFNNEDIIKILKRVQARLDTCGHCNGATYEDGLCTEHYTED